KPCDEEENCTSVEDVLQEMRQKQWDERHLSYPGVVTLDLIVILHGQIAYLFIKLN
ncbi:hypothetical protein RUM43_013238, partial [Polyplax serrata]